jgi:hypothetical protein
VASRFHCADSRRGRARHRIRDLLSRQDRAIAQRRSVHTQRYAVAFAVPKADADAATADAATADAATADAHAGGPDVNAGCDGHTQPEPDLHVLRGQGR